jgi:hypothetical protein
MDNPTTKEVDQGRLILMYIALLPSTLSTVNNKIDAFLLAEKLAKKLGYESHLGMAGRNCAGAKGAESFI